MVVLINVKDFSVAGEFIVNTKITNQDFLNLTLEEKDSHNEQSLFSTSYFVPLITSFGDYLIIGKTNEEESIPLEYQLYDL